MAQKLLSDTPLIKLHIALFLLIALIGLGNQTIAQTVLKPGDVVIVSVNADTNSVDIMPLIDIEEGTTFYLADGKWNDSTQTFSGNEVVLTTRLPIQAGTNLSLLARSDSLFDVSGSLDFKNTPYHVFVYQKLEEKINFIYAAGWGEGPIWNSTSTQEPKASDIPGNFTLYSTALLSLNEEPNQQYFIRNGASGTKSMLASLIGDESNWRGGKAAFTPLGISFNIMEGPVIQFKNTLSRVRENDSTATLNVAIYEHDGSRLSVDLALDTLRSVATAEDFGGFRKATINFTGIVGDYTQELEIPIQDNTVFNGRNIGIFSLQNLTEGNFGDFRSHNLIVEDNENPNVIISRVALSGKTKQFVEITNLELVPLNLSEWGLETNNAEYTFKENVQLPPGQSVRWYDYTESEVPSIQQNAIYSTSSTDLLEEGGLLTLKNHNGKIIHQVRYSKKDDQSTSKSGANVANLAVNEVSGNKQLNTLESLGEVASALELSTPGWKVLPYWKDLKTAFSEKEFYGWNEDNQQFERLEDLQNNFNGMILGYFETGEFEKLSKEASQALSKQAGSQNLEFSLSATDHNENEVIDQLEGLNLVFNNLDKELNVGELVSAIETKYPKVTVHPVVYGIEFGSTGTLTFKALQRDEAIDPKSPFWMMLDTPMQNKDLRLDASLFSEGSDSEVNSSENPKQGQIVLTLSGAESSKSVQINFSDEESTNRIRDLNSYQQLQLPNQDLLQFSFKQSADFFKEFTMPVNMNQPMQIPVYFGGIDSEEYSIAVSDWGDVPDGWNIILRDLYRDKEYELSRNFALEFEHTFTSADSEADAKAGFSIEQEREDERFVLEIVPAGVVAEEDQEVSDKPEEIELYQNYPNPFNPITTISFYLPESQEVRLSVFNIVGQPVSVIVEGTLSAGQKQFEWDATDKPSGMYIYQLEVGNRVMTRKMTLVK